MASHWPRRSLLQNVFLSFLYLSVPFFFLFWLKLTISLFCLPTALSFCLPYWEYCDIGRQVSQPLRWYRYHWEIKPTLSVSSCSCCLALYCTSQCWVLECWWSWCCWWCCSAESWRSPPRPEDTQVSQHSRETRVGCTGTKPWKCMLQGSEMFDGGQNNSGFKLYYQIFLKPWSIAWG